MDNTRVVNQDCRRTELVMSVNAIDASRPDALLLRL